VNKDDNIVIQSSGRPAPLQAARPLRYQFPVACLHVAHPINGVFASPIATTVLQQYGKDVDAPEQMWGTGSEAKRFGVRRICRPACLFKYPEGGPSLQTIDTPPGWVAVVPPLIP
jgi:hypothetical protein